MADLAALARDMVKACVARDWDAAYANADPVFVKGFTEFMSVQTWDRVRSICGNLVQIGKAEGFRHLLGPVRTVYLECKFERMVVMVEVSFTPEDKIVGLAMRTPGLQ